VLTGDVVTAPWFIHPIAKAQTDATPHDRAAQYPGVAALSYERAPARRQALSQDARQAAV
jgi:hypothetical protein